MVLKLAERALGDTIAIETIVMAGRRGRALDDLVLQVHF